MPSNPASILPLLASLPEKRLDSLKQLFWSELNYDQAQEPLSTRSWTPELQALVQAAPIPEKHNTRESTILTHFKKEVEARQAEQKHAVSLTHAQRYILRELRKIYDETESADIKAQVELLDRAFRQPQTQAVRNELNAIYKTKLSSTRIDVAAH
jgi:hypothetical protein